MTAQPPAHGSARPSPTIGTRGTIAAMEGTDSYFDVGLRPGAVTTVVARGELDAASSKELERVLIEALAGDQDVAVDLTQVTFIDSSGLRVVTAAARDAEAAGSSFVVSGASQAVRRIFEITGLGGLLATPPEP